MFETFLIALCSLLVALYIQARVAAREIRRNRAKSTENAARNFVLDQTAQPDLRFACPRPDMSRWPISPLAPRSFRAVPAVIKSTPGRDPSRHPGKSYFPMSDDPSR